MKEMALAERAGKNQIRLRARGLDKVTRIFDDYVRLVAISGELSGNPWEQVVEHAHHPRGVEHSSAGPFGNLGGGESKNFASREFFVAGTERARRSREANFFGIETRWVEVGVLAAAEGKGKTLAANVDDV